MKHFAFTCVIALILLFLPGAAHAAGWVQQRCPPLPSGVDELYRVSFGDALHGCAMARAVDGAGNDYIVVLTSSDGGVTWTRRADVQPLTTSRLQDLQMLDATHGWAIATNDKGVFGTILSTVDGGVTWQLRLITPRRAYALAFGDSAHGWVAGDFGAVYSTADGGATWQDLSAGQPDWTVRAMDFVDDRHGCLAGSAGMHFYARATENGCASWLPTNPAEMSWRPTDVALVDASHGVLVGGEGDMSTLSGSEIGNHHQTPAPANSVAFGDDRHVHVVGNASMILVSEDIGVTWHSQTAPVSADFRHVSFVDERHGWAVGSGPAIIAYDCTAPITTATGADGLWHNRIQTVHLSCSDDPDSSGVAGVARITTQVSGGTPMSVAGDHSDVTVAADAQGHTTDGPNTISFYATDKADNAEAAKTVTVRIDTRRPQTAAPARARVRSGRTARLKYIVNDQAPCGGTASVTIKVTNKKHRVVRTLALGPQQINVTLKAEFQCSLPHGRYRYSVYATDIAGNKQSKVGTNLLIVR
jgi:photosystem II stability/assembly factor-like uncharacterized protein